MLKAAPKERLDFTVAIPLDDQTLGPDNASRELSRKQEKKRQAAVSDLKTRVKALLAAKKSSSESPDAFVEPRYDEVFLNGQQWLNELANPVDSSKGTLTVDDSLWKSPSRYDPDLS